ncbi:hypothetical protein SVAN01_00668 [Stagonosporopsis vannaccii]|nr:hypothetical protein SVAN01_00668 [Stagonosporopsis vannaccii]
MGHVASGDNTQEEMLSQQEDSDKVGSFVIPTTPNNKSEITMSDTSEVHSSHNSGASRRGLTPTGRHTTADGEGAVAQGSRETADADTETTTVVDDKDAFASLDPNTTLLIPITNPSAFPIQRLQEVQSQRQPSTHIANMWCHKTPSGPVVQVSADVQDGSVNHVLIRDERWISALGLGAPDFDTIRFDATKLRLDETFTIRVFLGQRTKKLDAWVMGELVGARHAYLYWLDERRSADPKSAPYAAEAKAIATRTGRRWPHVMSEIERVWGLEQGGHATEYRENRVRYLGEDPTYAAGAEERREVRSMFG